MLELVLAVIATFAAGIIRTSVGVGSGIFLTASLLLLFDPKITLAIMAFLQIGLGASAVGHYWGKWDHSLVLRLVGSVLVGVLVGSWLVTILPAEWMRRIIGAGLAAIAMIELLGRPRAARTPVPGESIGFGFLTGLAGSMANAGGAVLALYLRRLPLRYDAFLGTLSAVVLGNDVFRLGVYWQFGLLGAEPLKISLLLLPVAFGGGWVGFRVRHYVPEQLLRRVVLGLVAVIGIILLV